MLEQSLKCIAWNGRLVVLGFSSGEIPNLRLNRVMLKHIAVLGLNLGGYHQHEPARAARAHARLFELYAEGALRPVIHSRAAVGAGGTGARGARRADHRRASWC